MDHSSITSVRGQMSRNTLRMAEIQTGLGFVGMLPERTTHVKQAEQNRAGHSHDPRARQLATDPHMPGWKQGPCQVLQHDCQNPAGQAMLSDIAGPSRAQMHWGFKFVQSMSMSLLALKLDPIHRFCFAWQEEAYKLCCLEL